MENFLVSAKAILAKVGGYIYKKTLQVAEASTISFLLNSHKHTDVEGLQSFMATQMQCFNKQQCKGLPRTKDLLMGLNRHPIWDSIRKKDRPKGYKLTQVIHVEVLKGQEDECWLLLKMVLLSPQFKRRFNLPLFFIKALKLTDSRKEKMQHVIRKHRSALASMEHTHLVDFAVLDKKMGELMVPDSGATMTMRRCLLAMKAKDGLALFLTVEKDFSGASIWFTYASKNQAEAAECIVGLPLYLCMMLESADALRWFTEEAVERMGKMEWDAEQQ